MKKIYRNSWVMVEIMPVGSSTAGGEMNAEFVFVERNPLSLAIANNIFTPANINFMLLAWAPNFVVPLYGCD